MILGCKNLTWKCLSIECMRADRISKMVDANMSSRKHAGLKPSLKLAIPLLQRDRVGAV